LERKLEKQAEEKGLSGEDKDRYMYGTMVKETDWRPKPRRRPPRRKR
jgi:hypothetical protein